MNLGDGVQPDEAGTHYFTVYAGNRISQGEDRDTQPFYDSEGYAGYIVRYDDGNSITKARGDRINAEEGGDQGTIGWARLTAGTDIGPFPRGINGGDHYVWGRVQTDLPMVGTFNTTL